MSAHQGFQLPYKKVLAIDLMRKYNARYDQVVVPFVAERNLGPIGVTDCSFYEEQQICHALWQAEFATTQKLFELTDDELADAHGWLMAERYLLERLGKDHIPTAPHSTPMNVHQTFRERIRNRCTASDADLFEKLVWEHILKMDEAFSTFRLKS